MRFAHYFLEDWKLIETEIGLYRKEIKKKRRNIQISILRISRFVNLVEIISSLVGKRISSVI